MLKKIQSADLSLFLTAVVFIAFGQGIWDSTFNNFLKDTFALSNWDRTLMELPRELPGFLVAFVGALLFFFCTRRLAVIANILAACGMILVGFLHRSSFAVMLCWLFVYSMGQHIFLPLNSGIGMELAKEGETGKVLGKLGSAQALAAVCGSLLITLLFSFIKFPFQYSFLIGACGMFLGALFIARMKVGSKPPAGSRLRLRKEYGLFYWITILYGTRKQIFLTFAPWILVKEFHQPTQLIALLLFIGGLLQILFRPILGALIDKKGERFVLGAEALLLIGVCLGYGFGRSFFTESIALIIACCCYVTDQLLMSVGIARATYLRKIALDPNEISSTLSLGTTIDHVPSILIALFGGLLMTYFGYPAVFAVGAIIAVINFISVQQIRSKPIETGPIKTG